MGPPLGLQELSNSDPTSAGKSAIIEPYNSKSQSEICIVFSSLYVLPYTFHSQIHSLCLDRSNTKKQNDGLLTFFSGVVSSLQKQIYLDFMKSISSCSML